MDRFKKYSVSNRFVSLICIFAVVIVGSGCNRKVGVKPGGTLKTSTSKCKCKKKNGGIYSETFIQSPSFFYIDHSKVI
jgi:hypothetical protein